VALEGVVATQLAGVHKSRAMHKSPTVHVSHQKEILVKAMFDTGVNVITLSTRIADRFNVPRVKRDRPIEIHNFEGISTAKDAGVYYTFPITFHLHDHYDKATMEILQMPRILAI
jgi:hypothetical protein